MRLSLVLAFLNLAMAQQPSAARITDRFPESEDKETVTSTCSACHTLARVAANNRDPVQWAQTVKAHDKRGLKLEPDEATVIVNYLSTYFGPKVYLNTATVEDLSALPHFDAKLAEVVVRYRQKNGPFRAPEDLIAIVGAGTFAQVRNRVFVNTAESSAAPPAH